MLLANWKVTLTCICAVLAGVSVPSHALPAYSITDLGTLGGSPIIASDINNAGQVVGTSYISPFPANSSSHAFLYSNGGMRDLGTIRGPFSNASSINNAGQIVGSTTISETGPSQAFLYDNGVMYNLGTLGGNNSSANGINNAGQVVGNSDITSASGLQSSRAFLYSGGVMRNLGTMAGDYSEGRGINDAGQVVGITSTSNTVFPEGPFPHAHAFLYSEGMMKDLGTLGGFFSGASAINNVGQIAGSSLIGDGAPVHAFLYSNGVMTDIGASLGRDYSFARDINNAGQVVGFIQKTGELIPGGTELRAFLYNDGIMNDLNLLADSGAAGWTLSFANAINDIGQIVGTGILNGEERAYLLTPMSEVPEPPMVLLMLVGILGLASVRGRRQPASIKNFAVHW